MDYSRNKIELSIVFILVALTFSNFFGYLEKITSGSINPLKLYIINIALTLLLMMVRPNSFVTIFKLPIYRWMLFYFVIILIWLMLPNSHANIQDTRDIILTIIILFSLSTLIYFDDSAFSATRKALLFVTLLAIIINILEFFIPNLLFPEGTKVIGRSAGFRIDANESSEGIILGLLFSYGVVKEKFKTIFLFAALLGIVVTFSRSGIASWFLIVFMFSILRIIPKKTILLNSTILFLSFLVLLPILINFIDTQSGNANLINRISFDSSTIQDNSSDQRFEIAEKAWELFTNNPLIGSGLYTTKYWELPVSPHNTYLRLMAEFGIFGLLIFISILIASTWRSQGEAKKLSIIFILYILIIGLASHNVLVFTHFLVSFALMANMSNKSRFLTPKKQTIMVE